MKFQGDQGEIVLRSSQSNEFYEVSNPPGLHLLLDVISRLPNLNIVLI